MDDQERVSERFEEHRARMRAVAYRVLGSSSEADDAVQEAWLRTARTDIADVRELEAWLTTTVARVALNMLRARRSRPEPAGAAVPDPVVEPYEDAGPEQEALLGDGVAVALLVVLETLTPPERIAFVLHDMFDLPFDEIAPIVERSPQTTRQLASRARRRVRGAAPPEDEARPGQRVVVEAFLAAARDGDVEALVEVLHPEVVLRVDLGPGEVHEVRGAARVANQAGTFDRSGLAERVVLVGGTPGVLGRRDGEPASVLAFRFAEGRIAGIDILADPERLRRLDLPREGS